MNCQEEWDHCWHWHWCDHKLHVACCRCQEVRATPSGRTMCPELIDGPGGES